MDLLHRLLCSLETEARAQFSNLEILIVASACQDDTESVVHEFSDRIPVRLIVEQSPGLSRARNTALANTNADAILWLDDDTEILPGFILAYIQALEQYPDATYFAGKISPAFEGNPPPWVPYIVQQEPSTYSLLDLGEEERKLNETQNEFPFGANMLVRRSALKSFSFREDLGRDQNPGNLVGGEETEMFQTLSSNGHHGIWIPKAEVLHWLPAARQTFRYFAAYQYAVGIVGVKLLKQNVTPFAWTLYPQYLTLIGFGRLSLRPDIWVPALIKLQRERGRVAEVRTNKRLKQQ